eukprot:970991_1
MPYVKVNDIINIDQCLDTTHNSKIRNKGFRKGACSKLVSFLVNELDVDAAHLCLVSNGSKVFNSTCATFGFTCARSTCFANIISKENGQYEIVQKKRKSKLSVSIQKKEMKKAR